MILYTLWNDLAKCIKNFLCLSDGIVSGVEDVSSKAHMNLQWLKHEVQRQNRSAPCPPCICYSFHLRIFIGFLSVQISRYLIFVSFLGAIFLLFIWFVWFQCDVCFFLILLYFVYYVLLISLRSLFFSNERQNWSGTCRS